VNISQTLQSVLESWALPENRLTCITTGNGSNMIVEVGILKWNCLACFGHNLQLAITIPWKMIRLPMQIGVAHKIINSFAHSWKKRANESANWNGSFSSLMIQKATVARHRSNGVNCFCPKACFWFYWYSVSRRTCNCILSEATVIPSWIIIWQVLFASSSSKYL